MESKIKSPIIKLEANMGAGFQEFSMPLDELPETGDKTARVGEEFWCRRQLRPDGEGSNFHNLPLLRFGIDYEGDTARLSVPSMGFINGLVEKYNPGGFTFEEASGTDSIDTYFDRISRKKYPMSNTRDFDNGGVADKYRAFIADSEPNVWPDRNILGISPYEHDMVDHLGIFALPTSEADKIVYYCNLIIQCTEVKEFDKATMVNNLDRMMDLISAYAIADDIYDIERKDSYKDFLWRTFKSYQSNFITSLAFTLMSNVEVETDPYYDEHCEIDRTSFDAKIAELKELES
jgi:hypothetical protein